MFSTKNKIIILVVLVVALFMFSKGGMGSQKKEESKTAFITPTTVEKVNKETYYGVLPCEFCDGVETTLVLKRTEMGTNGTYEYYEKKLGIGDSPATIKYEGIWTTSYGVDDEHPDAEVIVLNPDDEEVIIGYFVVDDEHLEELDFDGFRYEDPENHRLKLKK